MAVGGRQVQQQRRDALSRRRIVEAAVEILDADGEAGLTFRALAARLRTGPGAIYWHVANKDELLAAAAGSVLAAAGTGAAGDPEQAVRRIALSVFDAVDAHPWVAAQLSGRASRRPALLTVFENLGRQVQALGVPAGASFAAATALLNHVVGAAVQNSANARTADGHLDRTASLRAEAEAWLSLDAAAFPFLHLVAAQMRDHDDHEQFLAGVDLLLAGLRDLAARGA